MQPSMNGKNIQESERPVIIVSDDNNI